MNIGKAIYGILSGTTAVTDIVGTKIFPEIAEQETAVPFVIYQVQSVQPEDTHDGPSKLDEVRVEVLCYDDAYNGAADLASAVRGALDRVRGTYNGVNVESVQFNDVDFEIEYDPRRYSQVLTFTFRVKRDDIEIALGTPITGAQLGDLSDVNVTGVTDNQILSYDAASDTWVPAADAGGPDVLDDLSDVDTGEPEDGQMLAYQQGTWSAIYQDEIVLPIASVTGLQAELNTIPDALTDLDDVKIVGTPAEGDALVYQSGFWSRGTAGASTLDELDDVQVPTPSSGAVLQYNGTYWAASALSIPSVPSTYYHQRYVSEAGTLRSGATETVELYYTAQADGDGLSESASSDTPSAGNVIRRKLWYAEKAQADPDTSADWTQFADIADDTAYATAKATLLAYLKARTGGTVPISLKMTWEDTAAVSYLLDDYSGAAAAYSLRLLSSTYSGDAVEVYNGTSYADIGFSNGELDTTALAAHCGSNDGFVSKWYDQSGNSNDAAQATTANMPKIYDGATGVVTENGKPALEFTGSEDLDLQSDFSDITTSTIVMVMKCTTSSEAVAMQYTDDTRDVVIQFNRIASNLSVRFYPDATDAGKNNALNAQLLMFTQADSAAVDMHIDGSAAIDASNTRTLAGDASVLGSRNGSMYFIGTIQAVIIYPSDQSSNRTNIEDNINTFYSIY